MTHSSWLVTETHAVASPKLRLRSSLTGDYRHEHLFALQQALELYDCYSEKIQVCCEQIEQQLAQLNPQIQDPLPLKKPQRQKKTNKQSVSDLRQQLHQIAGVDLTVIDGLNVLTVQTILFEIGTEMSKWPTLKHFTSWLGLSPQNDQTGEKWYVAVPAKPPIVPTLPFDKLRLASSAAKVLWESFTDVCAPN